MATIGREYSTPAAFGWEWTEPDSGTRFQLAYPVGTASLTFGGLPALSDRWTTMMVSEPERFLQDERPATRKEWRVVVDRWFAAAEVS